MGTDLRRSIVVLSLMVFLFVSLYYLFVSEKERFVAGQIEDGILYGRLIAGGSEGLRDVSYLIISRGGKVLKKVPPSANIDVGMLKKQITEAFAGRSSFRVVKDMLYVIVPAEDRVVILKRRLQKGSYFNFVFVVLAAVLLLLGGAWFVYALNGKLREKDERIYEYEKITKELNNRLENMRFTLSSVLNRSGCMFMFIDDGGRIRCLSKNVRKLFSVRKGYVWEEIDVVELKKVIRECMSEKRIVESDIEVKGRFYHVKCMPVCYHRRRMFMVSLIDVTEKKRLASAKAEMVADVSHELKTPLSVIRGYLEMLETMAADDQKKMIETINKRVDQLVDIVNSIIMLHKVEGKIDKGHKKEAVDIPLLLKEVITEFEDAASKKGITLRFEVSARDIPPVLGVKELLHMGFRNLLDNAVKYTDFGEIRVVVEPYVDNYIKVEIIDTGIGIPESELGRVFDRFFVGEISRKKGPFGSGIGLAITKHIVESHGGNIYVDSRLGFGTTFTVVLPIVLSSVVAS